MKYLLIIFFSFIQIQGQDVYAQSNDEIVKILERVDDIEQVDSLQKIHPQLDISSRTFLVSDSSRFPRFISAKKGQIIQKRDLPVLPLSNYKIFGKHEVEVCKVKYIFLSGDKYDSFQIDSLRQTIIERYKAGQDFTVLVNEYTMDGNPTGETTWFYRGMLVQEFDDAVRKRKKDEIFTVDVAEQNWYYVVLKTHENKYVEAIKAIEIRSRM